MPTYNCSIRPGLLDDDAKGALARAITRIHSEATGAPTWFVQVVIDESPHRTRFLNGRPADDHIWIRADIRAGRTELVRERLAAALTAEVAAIAAVPETAVWVYLCNLQPTDMVEYGRVLPPPGGEAAWTAALPAELKARLLPAGD